MSVFDKIVDKTSGFMMGALALVVAAPIVLGLCDGLGQIASHYSYYVKVAIGALGLVAIVAVFCLQVWLPIWLVRKGLRHLGLAWTVAVILIGFAAFVGIRDTVTFRQYKSSLDPEAFASMSAHDVWAGYFSERSLTVSVQDYFRTKNGYAREFWRKDTVDDKLDYFIEIHSMYAGKRLDRFCRNFEKAYDWGHDPDNFFWTRHRARK